MTTTLERSKSNIEPWVFVQGMRVVETVKQIVSFEYEVKSVDYQKTCLLFWPILLNYYFCLLNKVYLIH